LKFMILLIFALTRFRFSFENIWDRMTVAWWRWRYGD
jgi:hypothetical protein